MSIENIRQKHFELSYVNND